MDHKRILFIANPVSGKGTADIQTRLLRELQLAGHTVAHHLTSADRASDQGIYQAAAGYDVVLCCGGDGTLNAVINGLLSAGHSTPILYVPSGTTNDLARSLHLPSAVPDILELLHSESAGSIDVGLLNDQQYFTYVASMGAFTDVSYTTPQKTKNKLGHNAYILQAITNLPQEMRPVQAKISLEDEEYVDEFLFCSISNSTSIGGLLSLDDGDVRFDDGLFEAVLIHKPQNPGDLPRLARAMKRGEYLESHVPGITYRKTARIDIETADEAAWTLDGEYGGAHRAVRIDVLRNRVNLLYRR